MLQQYIVDQNCQVEAERLKYIRKKAKKIFASQTVKRFKKLKQMLELKRKSTTWSKQENFL